MSVVRQFLSRTRGVKSLHPSDVISYFYLLLGTLLMFGPILWLVLSSFKSSGEIAKFPPRFLPYDQVTVQVEGYNDPLPLFNVRLNNGSAQMVQVAIDGATATMVNPNEPGRTYAVRVDDRTPVEIVSFRFANYVEGVQSFNFPLYFFNSVIVTLASTVLTLFINSLAAFALSKYQFPARQPIFLIMLSTLMVPLSVILVPVFLVITQVGWNNNLLGVIVPAAATPTGVFLLRQYMLTIPDELIEAARIEGASEWRIYAQIILPLARPALAVLTIFSVMWRWNDFLWPLIVLSRSELFTLQIGLNSFQGELNVQWHLLLAITVVSLLPIAIVFGILQKYITTGIATTGMK